MKCQISNSITVLAAGPDGLLNDIHARAVSKMIIKSGFKKSVLQFQSKFFSSGVVRSPYRDVELSEVPYFQFVFQHLEYHKKRTAIVDGITHRSLR